MLLSHVNIAISKDGEEVARSFYGKLLGMREIPKPEPLRARGGVHDPFGNRIEIHEPGATRG
jgi:hypothetical protein